MAETKDIVIREYLIEVLSEAHKNELVGKGFDFYFKLRADLNDINKRLD